MGTYDAVREVDTFSHAAITGDFSHAQVGVAQQLVRHQQLPGRNELRKAKAGRDTDKAAEVGLFHAQPDGQLPCGIDLAAHEGDHLVEHIEPCVDAGVRQRNVFVCPVFVIAAHGRKRRYEQLLDGKLRFPFHLYRVLIRYKDTFLYQYVFKV